MIRRFFTRILIAILIAFCGYNWLMIRDLQAEVARLRTRQAVTDKKLAAPENWQDSLQAIVREATDLKTEVQSPETRKRLAVLQKQAQQLEETANTLWHRANAAAGSASPTHAVEKEGKSP
jgi:BMFP domain-containing protein YqiC